MEQTIYLCSFRNKNGYPHEEAPDLIIDARKICPMPLDSGKTGLNSEIQRQVFENGGEEKIEEIIKFIKQNFEKQKISIGVKCVGGWHRSVSIIELSKSKLQTLFPEKKYHFIINHTQLQ